MIIVWGSASIAGEHFAEALRISLEHVHRSRGESGCVSHNVSIDAEDENRLNFHEEWHDIAALQQHFRVTESIQFAARLTELAVGQPEMRLYEASKIS